MADVKHCTAINDVEGFLQNFYCRIKNLTESLNEKLLCLFVAFSKVNNEIALKETTARQLAKSEKRKNLASTFV
jgi:hypothetical protein